MRSSGQACVVALVVIAVVLKIGKPLHLSGHKPDMLFPSIQWEQGPQNPGSKHISPSGQSLCLLHGIPSTVGDTLGASRGTLCAKVGVAVENASVDGEELGCSVTEGDVDGVKVEGHSTPQQVEEHAPLRTSARAPCVPQQNRASHAK